MKIPTYKFNGMAQFLPFELPEVTYGKCEVKHVVKRKGDKMTAVSLRNAIFMGLPPTQITLTEDTIVHHYYLDGNLWMSSRPQEVEQAMRQLRKFRGEVLVGGLGLGLAAALLARKKSVKYVVVVDNSKDNIAAVHPFLAQSCPKMVFIESDLNDVLKNTKPGMFDWAFFDTWCGTGEYEFRHTVLPLRQLCVGKLRQDHIECWNESEMLGQIRMGIVNQFRFRNSGIPGHISILDMPEAEFQDMAAHDAKRIARQDWALWHKLRCNPTILFSDSLTNAIVDHYMASLTDPERYEKYWKQWEPKGVPHVSAA